MTKVFQTLVGDGTNDSPLGNCMQATVASLLDLPLEEVPNFITSDTGNGEANIMMYQFFTDKGFYPTAFGTFDTPIELYKKICEVDGGIGGFFYASIKSQTFEGSTHAVVLNANMEVVHDPNPNGKSLGVDVSEHINYIITFGEGWYIDIDGSIFQYD